jgi:hypothetical protein
MRAIVKKCSPYLVALVLFILFAVVYCYPVLEGKIIFAADTMNGMAAVQESVSYHETTGDYTFWTGSMFGGMPNYQIGGGQTFSEKIIRPIMIFFRWGHRNVIAILFFYLVSFFVLIRSFGVNKWMSIAGAFAVAFSSYFFIIIAASHNGKCTSITWMTMVLVGFLLIYRKKYGLGAILVMFFSMAGFMPHPQMSYYICLLIGVFFLAEGYIHIREKRYKDLIVATILFFVSFAIGIGTESSRIFANTEYAEQTMRGGHSELTKENDSENKTKGLDLNYATQWSYGIDESMTFLIPNYMGAASGFDVGTESHLYKTLVKKGVPRNSAKEFCSNAPVYWGEQPFTSGPVYMGAIICFLFLLALFIVKGPYKWALLAATILSILLSWGHNFMPFSRLFFDYFPMYNKFRAVASILIVAEITVPLLGFLAIKAIADKAVTKEKILKGIYWSVGITAGVCLIFGLFGKSFLSFTSSNDTQLISQVPDWIYQVIIEQRASMMQSDAFRSFFFILLGAAVIWLYTNQKLKITWTALLLGTLIVCDMWTVNKRFLNNESFKSTSLKKQSFSMQPHEKQILQDTTYFRVMNLATNTFNDARTSYYLKSIGGYSAAKLRRYQDLIDQHLSKMNMGVLNMLNAKYFIVPSDNGAAVPQPNPMAQGNAWYVDSLKVVNTPNEESDALNTINLRNTAVLDSQFSDFISGFVSEHDPTATVSLTKHTPEYVEYLSSAEKDGVIVFSEIYYPYGWKAYIDGKFTEHFRVNYMLRALNVPAGKHHIRFEFRPDSIRQGTNLSFICIGILFATILGYAGYQIFRYKNKKA